MIGFTVSLRSDVGDSGLVCCVRSRLYVSFLLAEVLYTHPCRAVRHGTARGRSAPHALSTPFFRPASALEVKQFRAALVRSSLFCKRGVAFAIP